MMKMYLGIFGISAKWMRFRRAMRTEARRTRTYVERGPQEQTERSPFYRNPNPLKYPPWRRETRKSFVRVLVCGGNRFARQCARFGQGHGFFRTACVFHHADTTASRSGHSAVLYSIVDICFFSGMFYTLLTIAFRRLRSGVRFRWINVANTHLAKAGLNLSPRVQTQ